MLQQSDADVKLAVVHLDIAADNQMVRDFHKADPLRPERKSGKRTDH
jgi:hypothetical protein